MSFSKTMLWMLIAGLFAGCHFFGGIEGSGNIVSKDLPYDDFTQVKAGNQFRVYIKRADQYKVTVHLDDNLQKHMKIDQDGDRLVLAMSNHHHYRVSKNSMRVDISMPKLTGIELCCAAEGRIEGFDSNLPIDISLSGASHLQGDIRAAQSEISLSGASKLSLSGSASKLELTASGASDAKLENFQIIDRADITLSGASDAEIHCRGELSYRGSGASDLTYQGEAKLASVNTSGASTIRQR